MTRSRDLWRRAWQPRRYPDAEVWSHSVVRRVLSEQGRSEVSFPEWAALHRELFPGGWPELRTLYDAVRARSLRGGGRRRAHVMVRLGWVAPGTTITRETLPALLDLSHGEGASAEFQRLRRRLDRGETALRELDEGVGRSRPWA